MKNLKTVIIIAIVATLVVGGVVAGILLGNNGGNNGNDDNGGGHEHAYTTEVVAPTCTIAGYTKYTCACGHTYNADEVAALNHRNTTEYVYPTVNEAGSKTSTCAVCGNVETKTLDAMTVSSPKVSKLIAKFIGAVAYSLEIGEDSTFVLIADSDNEAKYPDSSETITIKVAEAAISGKDDDLQGHLMLELNYNFSGNEENETETLAITVLVNGDDVSIEATQTGIEPFETEINLTEMLCEAICRRVGIDTDSATEIYYALSQVVKCLPIAEGLIGSAVDAIPELSETCGQDIVDVFELIGQDIIVETSNSDGSTTYTVDLAALAHLLDLIEADKTVEDYIADVFGESAKDEILAFIETLPDRTVREVSEAIIKIGEATDASMEDLYYAVDLIVYMATGAEISIEGEIYDRYDMTLAELIAEASDIPEDETAEFVGMIKETFAEVVEVIETTTLKNIINSIIGAEADAELTFLDDVKAMIEQYAGIVSIEVTVSADGELLSFNANAADGMISVDFENEDGAYTATIVLPEDIEIVIEYVDGSFSIDACVDGEYIASVEVNVEETVDGDDVTTFISADIDVGNIDSYIDIFWTTRDGALVAANASASVENASESYSAEINFVDNSGVKTITVDLPGDIQIEATFTDESFSVVGKVEGDVVASGDVTVEETTEGGKTITTVTANVESNFFNIDAEIKQTLENGALLGTAVKVVVKDDKSEYMNFAAETVYTDDSVTLDIYTKVNGQVIIDGSVTLSAEETDSKTEYALELDFDKIWVENAGYSTPGSIYPEVGESWTANVEKYLIIDAIINFVCER